MAYTGTYEQALRKNPTDYKLRAMGKKKYDLKRRKDGKVTISTKDDPKTREGFRSEKNAIEAERKSRKRTKSIFDAVKKIKEEQKSKEQKGSPSKQKEVKTNKDDVRKTDNEGERKRKIESQNKQKKDVSIPSQALENLATTVAGGSLLTGVVGYKVYKSAKGKQKLQMAMNKINDLPKDQQKEVGKKIGEKVSDRIKNAKPSLKQKIKTKLAQLKKKISSGLKRSGGGMPGNIPGTTPPGAGSLPPGFKGKSGRPLL
jgi:hypothetical protein